MILFRTALWFGILLIPLLFGCLSSTDVALEEVDRGDRERTLQIVQSPETGLSNTSLNYLNNRLLLQDFFAAPDSIICNLDSQFRIERHPEQLEILSDIALNAARSRLTPEAALPFYFSTLEYAGTYIAYYLKTLSPIEASSSPSAFLVIRRYNAAIMGVFEILDDRTDFPIPKQTFHTVCGKPITFTAPRCDLPFDLERIKRFIPSANFRVKNLDHFIYNFGIGVPMVAISDGKNTPLRHAKSARNAAYPVTVLLKISADPNHSGELKANFCFSSADLVDAYWIGPQRLPVEKDFTTPLAYALSQPDPLGLLRYMLDPDAGKKLQGLYLLDPYEPQKIPIVFVHGLMSSGKTWAQMVNTLKNDPYIRRHYQFWFYTYSSGNPILISARDFRNTLSACAVDADALGGKESFQKMVLVGHSMGGLLSKTTITTSYNFLENTLTPEPFSCVIEDFPLNEQKQLTEVVDFKPLPFIKRVVFIAVPHRGSDMATWQLSRIGSALITLPAEMVDITRKTAKRIAQRPVPIEFGNGIDNLSPNNPSLRVLSTLPFNPKIPYHSIIGNLESGPVMEGSDGIVPYWSSHLDGAVSEKIVHSNHSVHTHPLAIHELRRILLQHLEDNGIQIEKNKVDLNE